MPKKRRTTSHQTIRIERSYSFSKILVFLISISTFICLINIEQTQSQTSKISPALGRENLDYEILELNRQLNNLESRIIPIDTELQSLKENHEKITTEITLLKEYLRGPKSLWDKVTGIFNERKLKKLLAESQYISEKIIELQRLRDPLIKEFIALADRLIGRAEVRVIALMDIINKNESSADKASEQISTILELTQRVSALRDKYISDSYGQIKTTPLLLQTDDPEKLKLGAKILKNLAIQYRSLAEKKKREIRNMQISQKNNEMMLEKYREIQRSNEERESGGLESGASSIAFVFNEAEIKRKIEEIKKNIGRLSIEIRDLEEKARNMDNQSKSLEQRASQIEATPKGK
ncbi:TPA: hypothetical protein ENS27_18380 [bacterium]|nr:hypothetical protein [bacterium]